MSIYTRDAIISKIRNSEVIHDLGCTRIVQIDDDTIVKYGKAVKMVEADIIKFVGENTNVPVPIVKNVFANDGVVYIIMSKIPGIPLDKVWKSIKSNRVREILSELKKYVVELRNIKNTSQNYIGSINGNPCFDIRRYERMGGPFKSNSEATAEEQFN